jgi:O-acetyl-ADP-ribose deacetylase (regulator of RNase III)
LKARYIIHAVGPIWRGGSHEEARLLAACYSRSFELAAMHRVASIAFPSISTGAFGYPIELAAPIAISEARSFASRNIGPRDIIFCCFSSQDFDLYEKLLG